MNLIKTKFNIRSFVAAILMIAFIACMIVPFTTVIASANNEENQNSSENENQSDNSFKGYADDTINIHEVTRLVSSSYDAPSLTVLVHGQGGGAYNWSNNLDNGLIDDPTLSYEEKLRKSFSYDMESLIEELRALASSADVFLADVQQSTSEAQTDTDTLNYTPSLKFHLIRISSNDYNADDGDYITELSDVSKHIIVVFQSSIPDAYHRDVYEELHNVIDMLSYDILYLTGKIPKVNLISHSRGGITSMMYATGYRENSKTSLIEYEEVIKDGDILAGEEINQPETYDPGNIIHDHPFNVAGLYSMGTPYLGTDWDTKFDGLAHKLLGSSTFETPSAKNILDETIQNEIRSCWEVAVNKNPSLKLDAIAGTFDLSFVLGLLSEDYTALNVEHYFPVSKIQCILDIIDEWGGLASAILTTIDAGLIAGTGATISIPVVGWVLTIPIGASAITVAAANAAIITAINNLHTFEDTYSEQLQSGTNIDQTIYTELTYVLRDFVDAFNAFGNFIGQFTGETNIIHNWGDLFIDTESQLADGFSNVEVYKKLFYYSNIDYEVDSGNNVVITYDSKSFEYKKSENQPGIPHNLEARDAEIINYICDDIELAIPSAIYNYEVIQGNTVKITGFTLPDYYFDASGNVIEKFQNLKLNLNHEIDCKPISHIDDYAFSNFANLAKIILPDSLQFIGDRAFSNCTGLAGAFNLPANLMSVGEAVFYNCTGITSFYIEKNKNPELEEKQKYTTDEYGILYDKDAYCQSDGLQYSIVTENKGKTLVAYPAGNNAKGVTLPIGVTNIAAYAFSGNVHVEILSVRDVRNIGPKAFEGCTNLEKITGNQVRYIGENALDSTKWFLANNGNDLYIGDVFVKSKTNNSSFDSTGYTSIYAGAFKGNKNIESVLISPETVYVGADAFESCSNLTSVIITPLNTFCEFDVFAFRYYSDDLNIFVPRSKESQYESYVNLSIYDDMISPIISEINFDSQGGYEVDPIEVYYGDPVPLPSAGRPGYHFSGWKMDGQSIATNTIWEEYASSVTLYAEWTPRAYIVNLDKRGGTGGDSSVTVYYDQPMPEGLTPPTRTGLRFKGYYSGKNGTGTQYYNELMQSTVEAYRLNSNVTLYAHWELISSGIAFDMQGGDGGTDFAQASYGTPMPDAIAPQRSGYDFVGYFSGVNGTGTQYYSYEMNSSRLFNSVDTLTLYAHWTLKEFEITVAVEDQQIRISSEIFDNGDTEVLISYGSNIAEAISSLLVEAYSENNLRAGYELSGFYISDDSSKTLIDWNDFIESLSESGETIMLAPKWEPIEYTLTLNHQGGALCHFGQSNSVSVSSYSNNDLVYIYFVPAQSGTINISTSAFSGDPYLYLYLFDSEMNLLAENDDIDPGDTNSQIVYAVQAGKEYYVGFRAYSSMYPCNATVSYSGVTMNTNAPKSNYSVLYDDAFPSFVKPYRAGYTFGGYYTAANGSGEKIYSETGYTQNLWNSPANMTLYALWTPNTYTLTFDHQGGSISGTSTHYIEFGGSMPSRGKPVKEGYDFAGYYNAINGGIQYYSADMEILVADYNLPYNVWLYAKWTPKTYTVTFNHNGGTVNEFDFSSTLTSYNREDMSYIYFVPNESGRITIWTTHTEGDPYLVLMDKDFNTISENDDGNGNFDARIANYVEKGEAYYICFRTYYGTKTVGTVQFIGVDVVSYENGIRATYNKVLPSVLVPTKIGYAFGGYYTGQNGQGIQVYDENGTAISSSLGYENISLYAQWSTTTYAYTEDAETTVYGETSLLNLSSATIAEPYVIKVMTGVQELTLTSTTSRIFNDCRIEVQRRTQPLTIRFVNVSMIAPDYYHAIEASGNFQLTIEYNGTVSIIGGGAPRTGLVKGCDAIHNSTSGATVILRGTGTLSLIGGAGSPGTNGLAGDNGADGADATKAGNGGDGSNGGNGGKGGTGGDGGHAICATNVIIESVSGDIYLFGGNGGNGGNGGKGGNGGNGGDAIGATLVVKSGGDGGNGGNGGNGGTGGQGGTALTNSYSKKYASCISPTITNGTQGNGGSGGNGGNGGSGGAGGDSILADGNPGSGGIGGAGGTGGSGYTNGSNGSSGSNG